MSSTLRPSTKPRGTSLFGVGGFGGIVGGAVLFGAGAGGACSVSGTLAVVSVCGCCSAGTGSAAATIGNPPTSTAAVNKPTVASMSRRNRQGRAVTFRREAGRIRRHPSFGPAADPQNASIGAGRDGYEISLVRPAGAFQQAFDRTSLSSEVENCVRLT